MARTTSFLLNDELERFLRGEVAEGRYSTASEVVREALRRMIEYKKQRQALERLIDEGIESAENEPLLSREQVFRMLDKVEARGSAREQSKAARPKTRKRA